MRHPDQLLKRDSVTLSDLHGVMNRDMPVFAVKQLSLVVETTACRYHHIRSTILRFIHALHVVLVKDSDRDFIQMLTAAVGLRRINPRAQHNV